MSRGDIVIMDQPQTEVYVGDTGYIVIKQKDVFDEECTVLIDPINAERIAKAILALAKPAQQGFTEWLQEDPNADA